MYAGIFSFYKCDMFIPNDWVKSQAKLSEDSWMIDSDGEMNI